MKSSNRDLLVLVKDESLSSDSIELELERIHQVLISFETTENLCRAHEVFDMNRYKIIESGSKVQKIMMARELKAFVFIINKN